MQTKLTEGAQGTRAGREADAILRQCVHCGFCSATCPTYQVLGDELDSPRGRIYLIKEVLEGAPVTRDTQMHLDRCVTCRSCETTCPSGVQYGHLIDLGREWVDERVPRRWPDRLARWGLRHLLRPRVFAAAITLARGLRPILPHALRATVRPAPPAGRVPRARRHAPKVWLLNSCVQDTLMPRVDAASRRVLDAIGVSAGYAPQSGCCGATDFHMGYRERALHAMRRNVDAWHDALRGGDVQALVMTASGCGAMVREYGHHLRHDPAYAERARFVSGKVMDIGEYLSRHVEMLVPLLQADARVMVFHAPCTLQHWQGLGRSTTDVLMRLGFTLGTAPEAHLCCGSAGTYSVLQPALSRELRDRKLSALTQGRPEVILSANVGCLAHLQSGADIPVMHWIEALDARLGAVE